MSRSSLGAICILGGLYFLTRLGSLSVLPVFLDEAVHIQWAERLYGEGRILRPVGSGRLLAVAAYGLALPFEDRLWAARCVAVLAGAVSLLLTVLLSHRLFGPRAAVVAGSLYVLSPFALVYDRLALSDGFLSMSIIGVMLATSILVQEPARTRARAGLAILIVLAVCSKVSALLFFLVVPLGLLTLTSERSRVFRPLAGAFAIGLLGALPMLWFFVSNGAEVSAQHILGARAAGSVIRSTVLDMRDWAESYFSAPVVFFAAASAILLRNGPALWLVGSVVLPFLLFALFSQPWSARYVLPTLPPLLILVAGGIDAVTTRLKPPLGWPIALVLAALISVPGVSFDRDLLLDPARAPFPKDDRLQLVTGWPSGYGVLELSARLKHEAGPGPLTAFVDTGGTRTVPTSLALLLGRHPSVRLVEGDLESAAFRALMTAEAQKGPTFAIIGPRPVDLDLFPFFEGGSLERLEVFQKPGGEWAATLFRLRSPSAVSVPIRTDVLGSSPRGPGHDPHD
jgi:hypothetical protein